MTVAFRDLNEDHLELFDMTNDLHLAIEAVAATGEIDKRKIASTLDGLKKHTRSHCERGVLYFFQTGYPCPDSHRQEHIELIEQISEMTARFDKSTNAEDAIEILQSIHDCVAGHIYVTDWKQSSYFGAHRVLQA